MLCRGVVRTLRRLGSLALGVMGLLILAACGGSAQPAIVTLPPTETATREAVMAAPTDTIAANTAVAVVAASATPRPTLRSMTPTAGPSPTSLLGPTKPPTPVTVQPTLQPTLSRLRIEYFTTDSSSAVPGENLTLFWGVRGADEVRIYRLDDAGERIYRWDVASEGRLSVSVPGDDREVAVFLLSAQGEGGEVEQELLVPLACPYTWFFDPAPESCPVQDPQVSIQVEQPFERGRMFWVETLDRIFVIFDDGEQPRWAQYPDEFEDGQPARDDNLVAPPGLEQPVRGFGKVWRESFRVSDRLGWATSPEVSYDGLYQSDASDPDVATLYLRMRDGGILALDAERDQWEILPPPAN